MSDVGSREAARSRGLPNRLALNDHLINTYHYSAAEQQAHEVTGGDQGHLVLKSTQAAVDTEHVHDVDIFHRSTETGVGLLVHLPNSNELISTANEDTGYVKRHFGLPSVIKHASLGRGQPADGFEVAVKDGVVKELNNHSGHYEPDLAGFRSMLHAMAANGVDVSKAKFKIKLFPTAGTRSKRGYRHLDNQNVSALARSLQLGKFLGASNGTYRFQVGNVRAQAGASGQISMVETTAGFVPGSVLRTAASKGYGPFDQTVIHPSGKVEFRFQPAKGAPADAKATVELKKGELAAAGLALDEDRLLKPA